MRVRTTSKRRELLCHKCMTKFTTNSKKRFNCKKCDPPKDKKKEMVRQRQHGRFQPTLGDFGNLDKFAVA